MSPLPSAPARAQLACIVECLSLRFQDAAGIRRWVGRGHWRSVPVLQLKDSRRNRDVDLASAGRLEAFLMPNSWYSFQRVKGFSTVIESHLRDFCHFPAELELFRLQAIVVFPLLQETLQSCSLRDANVGADGEGSIVWLHCLLLHGHGVNEPGLMGTGFRT